MRFNSTLFNSTLLIGLSFLLFTCSKNDSANQKFVIKEYYATNNEDAKNKVLAFLQTTTSYNKNVIYKTSTTFPDTEPNEGMWIMEGANNYLSNSRIDSLSNDTILEASFTVENILNENNNIVMRGSAMSDEFDNITTYFNTISQGLNKQVKIVDYNLESVNESNTTINVKVVAGQLKSIFFDPSQLSMFQDGLSPSEAFEQFENNLSIQLRTTLPSFYTNVSFYGITPYTHISDPNHPDYSPQQDPLSPLYDPTLEKCGTYNGATDCRVCYNCLWSYKENPVYDLNSWTGLQSQVLYASTKTVVENFINSLSPYSETFFIDSNIEVAFFMCGCPNQNYWQNMDLFLGKSLSY